MRTSPVDAKVVVTGAGSGIGRALAVELSEGGYPPLASGVLDAHTCKPATYSAMPTKTLPTPRFWR